MKWIKVSDQKPEDCQTVLVYGSATCGSHDDEPCVREAKFRAKDQYQKKDNFVFGEYDCGIDATYWMPMPDGPAVYVDEEDDDHGDPMTPEEIAQAVKDISGVSEKMMGSIKKRDRGLTTLSPMPPGLEQALLESWKKDMGIG